jgi:hypothetical protein
MKQCQSVQNPGRVNDVLKERTHIGSKQAAMSQRSA